MKPFFLILVILFGAYSVNAQDVKYIQLKQTKVTYVPKGYYISDVIEDRRDVAGVGTINTGGDKQSIDLKNGVTTSLKAFIDNNVKQDKNQQPVTLHITKLNADVRKKGGQWDVFTDVIFIFYAGDTKLVELSGNSHALISEDPGDYYESFIRQTVENDLKRFDDWWAQNKDRVVTTSSVKVNVHMGKTISLPDCMVYSIDRPLTIADFQGPVQGQEFEMAVTASGIGVNYSEQTHNGQIVVDLTITPYFNKAKSWFKKEGTLSVLAHEQTHFDIAAIKACELAATIRNTVFTEENYKDLLDKLQLQNGKDSGDEEDIYDRETNHGIITDKQQAWQKKITEQVRTIGCY